jgi:hypothetical protein
MNEKDRRSIFGRFGIRHFTHENVQVTTLRDQEIVARKTGGWGGTRYREDEKRDK